MPPNKVKPGGGLDFNQQSCDNTNQSLTALVPIDNPVLTSKAYPSFLFYIPDPSAKISHGEFSILTADEKKRIYQTSVTFTETPGIIKVEIPSFSQHALEIGQIYHWYFKIYCQDAPEKARFLNVDGWIKRVSLTPEIESKLEKSTPDIWYDAIAKEARNIIINPLNLTTRDRWLRLMQYINQEQLADELIIIHNVSDTDIKENNPALK
ncbi:MAG: DUF928 domain-containing protein [Cyanobacteria bacterium P01_A01_bin.40]